MNLMKTQNNRAIISAISDRVISEIQNIVGKPASDKDDFGTDTSTYHQGLGDRPEGSNVNLSKRYPNLPLILQRTRT